MNNKNTHISNSGYNKVSKCSMCRCKCCSKLICNSNIKSSVNYRNFNIIISSDINCRSTGIIYVLT